MAPREGIGAGTGFFGELHPYVAIGIATAFADLELREGAAVYGTTIRALSMPGGYVTTLLHPQPSARLTLVGPRPVPLTLTLEVEWNVGGTRQHVGAISLGTRF